MSSSFADASFLPGGAARPLPVRRLFGAILRRPGASRAVSVVSVVLIVAGVAMFAVPAVSDLIGRHHQSQLAKAFGDKHSITTYRDHDVPVGAGLTRLIVHTAQVSINVLVVQGTTVSALEAGAGHYPETPYPCDAGNVGIAGHRTTYGRPFNRIDQLHAGDLITLVTPVNSCVYKVLPSFDDHSNPWIVSPTEIGVVSQAGYADDHLLTMTSCNPKGSNAQRIVVRSELVSQSRTSAASPSPGASA